MDIILKKNDFIFSFLLFYACFWPVYIGKWEHKKYLWNYEKIF